MQAATTRFWGALPGEQCSRPWRPAAAGGCGRSGRRRTL